MFMILILYIIVAVRYFAMNTINLFILTLLCSVAAQPGYAAPATPESKVEIQKKNVVPSISPGMTKPLSIQKPTLLQKTLPANITPAIKPVLKPAASPAPASPVEDPVPSTEPAELEGPATSGRPPESRSAPSYQQPEYESGQAYEQDYGEGGYSQPGNYYPESDYDYYQQPGYAEPVQQPFRGVGGSLLEQQQFEFKPLTEGGSTAGKKEVVNQDLYEPGQVLVVTENMDIARQLQQAVANAGYRPKSRSLLSQLGLVLTTFRVPANVSVPEAVAQFQKYFPDFLSSANARYGQLSSAEKNTHFAKSQIHWNASSMQCAKNIKIGLIDGAVDTGNRQLTGSNIKASSVLPAGLNSAKSSHATALASLLVGNKEGLLPNAELYAVNVFRQTSDRSETTTAWIIKAINNLLEKKVSVINLSLGGQRDEILAHVVKIALQKQVSMVAAAGNSGPAGNPLYPAAFPEVIAVTAVDADRKIYANASRGNYIDIAAPGVNIRLASSGNNLAYSGTSFASAYVTAALAVLRANKPGLDPSQIKSDLMKNAVDLGKRGKDAVFGYGLLSAQGLCQG